MPLVRFALIGAQKCGTTSLANQLAQHPQVCFSRIKEPDFFSSTPEWRAGLDAYHRLFSPVGDQICGEASTMYTFLPQYAGTHLRLHAYNPEMKLIYLMRDPVERIISHYAFSRVRKRAQGPPEKEVLENPTYINRSRYAVQLRPYIEAFGRQQLLPLVFEEYVADPVGALAKVSSFLGIDPESFATADLAPQHRTAGEYHLDPKVRRLILWEHFDTVRAVVPASIRQPVRRMLSRRIGEKPQFDKGLRELLWRLLQDDIFAVEGLLGRPVEVWSHRS